MKVQNIITIIAFLFLLTGWSAGVGSDSYDPFWESVKVKYSSDIDNVVDVNDVASMISDSLATIQTLELGTIAGTALEGNTLTITTAQANEITANTANNHIDDDVETVTGTAVTGTARNPIINSQVVDAINDAITTTAPSQNAVFDEFQKYVLGTTLASQLVGEGASLIGVNFTSPSDAYAPTTVEEALKRLFDLEIKNATVTDEAYIFNRRNGGTLQVASYIKPVTSADIGTNAGSAAKLGWDENTGLILYSDENNIWQELITSSAYQVFDTTLLEIVPIAEAETKTLRVNAVRTASTNAPYGDIHGLRISAEERIRINDTTNPYSFDIARDVTKTFGHVGMIQNGNYTSWGGEKDSISHYIDSVEICLMTDKKFALKNATGVNYFQVSDFGVNGLAGGARMVLHGAYGGKNSPKQTASFIATGEYEVWVIDASASNVTVTLPPLSVAGDVTMKFKILGIGTGNAVTITAGSDVIDFTGINNIVLNDTNDGVIVELDANSTEWLRML